jgi:iron complex outermembrane receptor protein
MKTFLSFVVLLCTSVFSSAQHTTLLTGSVRDAAGKAVTSATITVVHTGQQMVTNQQGSFSIPGFGKEDLVVSITADGFSSRLDTFRVGQTREWIIILAPSWRELDQVVVSAEKKEASSIQIPGAITSFNTRQIKEMRLWNLSGLSGMVPNLYSAHSGDQRNVTSIRGLATTSYEQAVTTYIDGVSQFNLDTYMPQLFDVERVEVLRGPKGTLYGRNALGGVINVITRKPTNRFKGSVEASTGNFGLKRVGAAVRFPIWKDRLYIGSSALYEENGGYFTNIFIGAKYDRQRQIYGNHYVKYYGGERFIATLNVKHQFNRNGGPFPLAPNLAAAFAEPFKLNQNSTTMMQDDNVNASLSLQYLTSKGLRISGQTAWQQNYRFYRTPVDADFSPLDAISIVNNYGRAFNNVQVVTQEFRVQSAKDSKVDWTAGAYMFYQDNPVKQGTRFGNQAELLGIPDKNFTLVSTNIGRNNGTALFAQASWPITKNVQLITGLRFDAEKRSMRISGVYQKDPGIEFPTQRDSAASARFEAVSPKLGLHWKPSDVQSLYLMYSKGFRAGGLTALGSDPSQRPLAGYSPEHSHNIELGWKVQTAENTIRLQTAAFYSFVRRAQVPTLILPDAVTIIRNAGKMDSKGMEVSMEANVLEGLELIYQGGLTDARFTELSLPENDKMKSFDGNSQIFTPSYTSAMISQYSISLSEKNPRRLILRMEWQTFGKQYFDLKNQIRQDPYGLLNSRVALQFEKIELSVWGRNLTNKVYTAYGYDFGGVYLGNPRLLGATVEMQL